MFTNIKYFIESVFKLIGIFLCCLGKHSWIYSNELTQRECVRCKLVQKDCSCYCYPNRWLNVRT